MNAEQKIDGRRKYLSADEVAVILGISRSTVYREIASGNIQAKRFGQKRIRISLAELARYESEQAYEPKD